MEQANRGKIITGNWKMYKTIEEAKDFVNQLIPLTKNSSMGIFLAVPFTAIYPLSQQLQESRIVIGAQNMNDASQGAFTGEVAARMLKEAGAQFVLLGHSERRRLFKEDNDFINRKVKKAVDVGIRPILCVGETREEREAGRTEEVLTAQLTECLKDIDANRLKSLIVAYEPVWAIGTGLTAGPEMVEKAHRFCRDVLGELLSDRVAGQMIIQYGGSVTPSNAKELLSLADVDGLLVGGASLSLESFSQIVNDSVSQISK